MYYKKDQEINLTVRLENDQFFGSNYPDYHEILEKAPLLVFGDEYFHMIVTCSTLAETIASFTASCKIMIEETLERYGDMKVCIVKIHNEEASASFVVIWSGGFPVPEEFDLTGIKRLILKVTLRIWIQTDQKIQLIMETPAVCTDGSVSWEMFESMESCKRG